MSWHKIYTWLLTPSYKELRDNPDHYWFTSKRKKFYYDNLSLDSSKTQYKDLIELDREIIYYHKIKPLIAENVAYKDLGTFMRSVNYNSISELEKAVFLQHKLVKNSDIYKNIDTESLKNKSGSKHPVSITQKVQDEKVQDAKSNWFEKPPTQNDNPQNDIIGAVLLSIICPNLVPKYHIDLRGTLYSKEVGLGAQTLNDAFLKTTDRYLEHLKIVQNLPNNGLKQFLELQFKSHLIGHKDSHANNFIYDKDNELIRPIDISIDGKYGSHFHRQNTGYFPAILNSQDKHLISAAIEAGTKALDEYNQNNKTIDDTYKLLNNVVLNENSPPSNAYSNLLEKNIVDIQQKIQQLKEQYKINNNNVEYKLQQNKEKTLSH